MNRRWAALWVATVASLSCSPHSLGSKWPQADPLFHQEPRWLGADGAYSVSLGDGRILWLFGDTFVAKSPTNVRSESTMVHNTVGLQQGADPTSASMSFFWRGSPTTPTSFFPDDGDHWYWPAHGIRLGKALVLFLQRVKATPGEGLGFASDGWRTAIIDDATGEPLDWTVRLVTPPNAPPGLAVGTAAALDGDHVIALAEREPGDHAGFLARWTVDDLSAGRIDQAEWWTQDRGWVAQGDLNGLPSSVMPNAGPECSLHFDSAKNRWVHVRSEGFGASTLVFSTAPAPQGPWSTPQVAFRPPESDQPKASVYAGKAHPELDTGGGLAVTYAVNTLGGFSTLVNDTTLYYPHFAKLDL